MVKTQTQEQSPLHRLHRFTARLFFGASLVSIFVMFCAVLVTAFVITTTTHQTRDQYRRLQRLEREQDELQANWTRLRLEEGTHSSPSRIEVEARNRLMMHVPQTRELEVLAP
ncbi:MULTISPECIES: cell division protein FtsL [Zymobacter]|uniref:Cell division protein FtsL n=1 Tax=Zymobacter palmae TaxID=33074 RepID=A0A348HDG7_9GAMM|nr:cell division protein FtsL [Zymobacter palmae]BBG29669.1 cell division protein FtsL [Zymobacter palmae]